jgi:hypothetical protein
MGRQLNGEWRLNIKMEVFSGLFPGYYHPTKKHN